jgi:hypothetical protein
MRLRNFSRNRPEITNLNHQYALRRVDIIPSSMLASILARTIDSAETGKRM